MWKALLLLAYLALSCQTVAAGSWGTTTSKPATTRFVRSGTKNLVAITYLVAVNAVFAAVSTPSCAPSCTWSGHCWNDVCTTWDDCDGDMICINGRCGTNNCPPSISTAAPVPTGSPGSFGSNTTTTVQRVLILTTTTADVEAPKTTLNSYGIPYTILPIPQAGYPGLLPLEDAQGNALFSLLIIQPGQVQYDYSGVWRSALTDAQWTQIKSFEIKHRVRRITLDDSPVPEHGVVIANPTVFGCCNAGVTQNLKIKLNPELVKSGVVDGASVATTGLFHYPVTVTNTATTTAFALLDPSSDQSFPTQTAVGVIINYPDGRQQMAFYMAFGWWSTTSMWLGHIYVSWGSRQLYQGFRRIYLSLQVDDLFLSTQVSTTLDYRLTTADVSGVIAWQNNINTRLPAGSKLKLLLGYNGNGVVALVAPNLDPDLPESEPNYALIKPLGTGTNRWPANAATFKTFTDAMMRKDALYTNMLKTTSIRDAFFWCSHTYTHEGLDDATRYDVDNELSFNIQFAKLSGLYTAAVHSSKSMITPMITGLHNGDALASLVANGITSVVGDTTRTDCTNQTYPYHPWISTTASSNYNGYTVIPRQATVIYFNCSTPAQDIVLYNNMYQAVQGVKDWNYLLYDYETERVVALLMQLRHDGYMFHQANLRNADLPAVTMKYGGQTGKFGLLQQWTESVIGRFMQLVRWPIISPHMDDHTTAFLDRVKRDACNAAVTLTKNATHLLGFSVRAAGSCTVPVSVPGPVAKDSSNADCKFEQLGIDPLTVWVPVAANAAARTFAFAPAVKM
ncbi:uncharacterized protein SPPG_08039 [Spizellomyces punctatus DAOM BR117]|uniref:Uncharacterized protein n=1 Tax=Spizellomyces punctatus (strain DAOM BR117) TaxID=645134 RepID=A0A0L0H5E8_SPIPD|nr:uncharacterized protein SPPG_08039 [Spizellomyces punctatus DAOM BR117]KNC96447.1 hypothetical protein SPPG_08039 [Spizellomyces punctatus DAOM BR117]|eukprot:XP_016604487.1 hypothetical protein SPPG_08039 [Spizellomyces punctatus DAOM BR117]